MRTRSVKAKPNGDTSQMGCREQKEDAWLAVFLAERRGHQVNAVGEGAGPDGRAQLWEPLPMLEWPDPLHLSDESEALSSL